jgi:hypothetical protein
MIDNYVMCVECELRAMIQVYNKHVVPRCIEFAKNNSVSDSAQYKKLFKGFDEAFNAVLEVKEKIDNLEAAKVEDIETAQTVRDYLYHAGVAADKVIRYLPRDSNWPEWDEFLLV